MSQQRSANAVSGKTARACDSCLRRRARWYCAADDAFLCQSCDSSVHSANTLARRHDRDRLKSSSSSSSLLPPPPPSDRNSALPTWHQGFKRKARTPRHARKPVLLVPDLEALAAEDNNSVADNNVTINEGDEVEVPEEEEEEEEEEQLLYRVPIFDPVLAEFCSPPGVFDETNPSIQEEAKPAMDKLILPHEKNIIHQNHGFAGFNPSDVELAEFSADVENLLGQGLDDDSFCIDGLGLLGTREDERSQVKMELMDTIDTSAAFIGSGNKANFLADMHMEFSRESLDFNFDCGSPAAGGDYEVEVQKVETVELNRSGPTKVGLRLDYEAVIAAWSCRGCSPWTDGERPQFNPDDCWPDFMVGFSLQLVLFYTKCCVSMTQRHELCTDLIKLCIMCI